MVTNNIDSDRRWYRYDQGWLLWMKRVVRREVKVVLHLCWRRCNYQAIFLSLYICVGVNPVVEWCRSTFMSASAKESLGICIGGPFIARQLYGIDADGGGHLIVDPLGSCCSPRCRISFSMGIKKGRWGARSSEEFYSLWFSLIRKRNSERLASQRLSSSLRMYPMVVEKYGSQNSMLSTSSYLSST